MLKDLVPPAFLQGLLAGKSLESLLDGVSQDFSLTTVDLMKNDLALIEELKPILENRLPLSTGETILLTGATGFVGSFLLQQLLEKTTKNLVCLIRGDEARFWALLESNQIIVDKTRVALLIGDVGLPMFGLSNQIYDDLASKVSHIVHCAAWVHFFLGYEHLRDANVLGTWNVLKFAVAGNLIRPISYISSVSAILDRSGNQTVLENAPLDSSLLESSLDRGYPSTKHVAELLTHQASDMGIPICIFRLGTIGPHSKTSVMNSSDMLSKILHSFAILKAIPFLDCELEHSWMNIIPVDHASEAIVKLSLRFFANSSSCQKELYHIVNPSGGLLYSTVRAYYELHSERMRLLSFSDWKKELNKNSEALEVLGYFINSLSTARFPNLAHEIQLDTANAQGHLGHELCPALSGELLAQWIDKLSVHLNENQQQ
jgi:thioester reductase-like protein